jgi:hypothetical protein
MTRVSVDISLLDDEAFDAIVNADIREVIEETSADALRQPESLQRWHDTLLNMKRNLEYQFATNRAERASKYAECRQIAEGDGKWADYLAANERWRTGAMKFYRGVERRLTEAKRLLHEFERSRYTLSVADERDYVMREYATLRGAILQHKQSIEAATDDEDTGPYDELLWSYVQ